MSFVTEPLMNERAAVLAADRLADFAEVRDYFELLKPRVMSLVVFTALVGLVRAPANCIRCLLSRHSFALRSVPAPRAP